MFFPDSAYHVKYTPIKVKTSTQNYFMNYARLQEKTKLVLLRFSHAQMVKLSEPITQSFKCCVLPHKTILQIGPIYYLPSLQRTAWRSQYIRTPHQTRRCLVGKYYFRPPNSQSFRRANKHNSSICRVHLSRLCATRTNKFAQRHTLTSTWKDHPLTLVKLSGYIGHCLNYSNVTKNLLDFGLVHVKYWNLKPP